MSECTNNTELESLRQERDQLRADLSAERDKVYGLECGQLTRMERERDAARARVELLEGLLQRVREDYKIGLTLVDAFQLENDIESALAGGEVGT